MSGREVELKVELDEAGLGRLLGRLGPSNRVLLQRNLYMDSPAGDLRNRLWGLRLRHEIHLAPHALAAGRESASAAVALLAALPAPGATPSMEIREALPPEWLRSEAFILTVKGPSIRRGARVERTEEERRVSPTQAEEMLRAGLRAHKAPLVALRCLADDLPGQRLQVLGAADTLRRVHPLPPARSASEVDAVTASQGALRLEIDTTRFPDGSIAHEVELELPEAKQGDAALAAEAALRALLREACVSWSPSSESKYARFLMRGGFTD